MSKNSMYGHRVSELPERATFCLSDDTGHSKYLRRSDTTQDQQKCDNITATTAKTKTKKNELTRRC